MRRAAQKPEMRPEITEADRLEAWIRALIAHFRDAGLFLPPIDFTSIRHASAEDIARSARVAIAIALNHPINSIASPRLH